MIEGQDTPQSTYTEHKYNSKSAWIREMIGGKWACGYMHMPSGRMFRMKRYDSIILYHTLAERASVSRATECDFHLASYSVYCALTLLTQVAGPNYWPHIRQLVSSWVGDLLGTTLGMSLFNLKYPYRSAVPARLAASLQGRRLIRQHINSLFPYESA